jgi:hypothetical protein
MSMGEDPKYDFLAAAMSPPSKSPVQLDQEISVHKKESKTISDLPAFLINLIICRAFLGHFLIILWL